MRRPVRWPCCDAALRCSGANRRDYRCSASCDAAPCAYSDLTGTCTAGICRPARGNPGTVDCEPGQACTTEYGVAAGTTCVEPPSGNRNCFESCEGAPESCGSTDQHRCMPLVREDGGVCVWLASEEE